MRNGNVTAAGAVTGLAGGGTATPGVTGAAGAAAATGWQQASVFAHRQPVASSTVNAVKDVKVIRQFVFMYVWFEVNPKLPFSARKISYLNG